MKNLILLCLLFALILNVYSIKVTPKKDIEMMRERMNSLVRVFDNEIQQFIQSAENEFKNEIPHLHVNALKRHLHLSEHHHNHHNENGEKKPENQPVEHHQPGEHHKPAEHQPGEHHRPHHGEHHKPAEHHGEPHQGDNHKQGEHHGEHHHFHHTDHSNHPHEHGKPESEHHHFPLFDNEESVLWYHQIGDYFAPIKSTVRDFKF